jgi:hypothetical protein
MPDQRVTPAGAVLRVFPGRDAESRKGEVAEYGLPEWMFYVVGAMQIGAAIARGGRQPSLLESRLLLES